MHAFGTGPDVLEVTLRDGSYLIDFQFTAQDTTTIAGALEAVGFRWIEIGHGLGLNASASGHGVAGATDEQYLDAAASALTKARWGMFFIPGIGRAENLRLAARYKMHFVRIGTDITRLSQAESFIKQAKDLGMLVAYNGMKSYAISAEQWGRSAAQAAAWGADIVCLVDSAGSMEPEEISQYLRAAKSQSSVPLGFHGHDNLSLAMANTLRAVEEGAVMVDSSLQGMGRSAGNAVTEVLVAILQRRGLLSGVDMKGVLDVGVGLIRPLLHQAGIDPTAVIGGQAKFHSSFSPKVARYARKHAIDERDLIVRLCQEDLTGAPDDLLERLSSEIAASRLPRVLSVPAFNTSKSTATQGWTALQILLHELRPQAIKAGKFSALNAVIGESPAGEIYVSGNIQHTQAHVVGSVTYTTDEQLAKIAEMANGVADVLLLDVDHKPFGPSAPAATAATHLNKTLLLTYLDSRIWIGSVEDQLVRLSEENVEGVPVVIAGDHARTRLLAKRLAERRANVSIVAKRLNTTDTPERPADRISIFQVDTDEANQRISEASLVVVWPGEQPWFGATEACQLNVKAKLLAADGHVFTPDGLDFLQARNAQIVRVNMWPALAGSLLAAHESQRIVHDSLGWGEVAGVPVVAGGAMGRHGDVIVDSVREPSRVIGVADGQGKIIFQYSPDQAERVQRVMAEIHARILAPQLASVPE